MAINNLCVVKGTCDVWTNLSPSLSKWSGLLPLAFFILWGVNMWMAFQVGAARKKYGISYPTLYAVPNTLRAYGPKSTPVDATKTSEVVLGELITSEEAFAYNCVQRGHQNSVENYPIILALSLAAWGFPIPTGFAVLSWTFGRIFYASGYAVAPEKRNNLIAALLTYPALLTLVGLNLATAIFLFQGTLPYAYSS
jgi:glutathione S-transferase